MPQNVARSSVANWIWICWIIYRYLIGARSWDFDRRPSYIPNGGEPSRRAVREEESGARRIRGLTVLLHDVEELDDDLGARPDHDLALAGLLGVVHAVESIVEDGGADHSCGIGGRFSSRDLEMRYLGREGSYVSLRWHRAWRVPREGFCRSLLKRRSVSGP